MFRVERIPVRIDRPMSSPDSREDCQHLLEVASVCAARHIPFLRFGRKIKSGGILMKKFLATLLSLALCLGVATGCAGKETPAANSGKDEAETGVKENPSL